MAKYFRFPFAVSGTLATIPDTHQTDNTVNYTDGYTPNYGQDLTSQTTALPIERAKFNQLMYDLTGAVQQLQQFGVPDFITTAANGGTPFSYSHGARVRYNNGTTTDVYESLVDSNTSLPTVTGNWRMMNNAGSQVVWGGTAGGTANALTFSPTIAVPALVPGLCVNGIISATNTSGTVTMVVSANAAVSVRKAGAPGSTGPVSIAVGDLPAGNTKLFCYDGTYFILLDPRPFSHSINIAATSSTLDFTPRNGDYVTVTGTSTITAVTLAEGSCVNCVVNTSGLQFNPSANLILPTGASIVWAAGDTFALRGEAGGVVRLTYYCRASGQPLVAGSGLASVKTQYFGSSGTYTPSAGMLFCEMEAVAGGGGGGGCTTTASQYCVAACGAAGSRAIGRFTAAQIGSSQPVTIGAGGAPGSGTATGGTGGSTQVGSGTILLQANGGTGGQSSGPTGGNMAIGQPGTAQAGGTGDRIDVGNNGNPAFYIYSAAAYNMAYCPTVGGPYGGSAYPLGFQGTSGQGNGSNAVGIGAPGAGSYSIKVAGNSTGGSGQNGGLFVREYCNQ